jgi:hypothetical protein
MYNELGSILERPQPDLIKYPGVCLEGLKKHTKNLVLDS